jgi:hypothetical protein
MSDRIVFSTDAWPERDRFAAWREEVLGRYPLCHLTTQDPLGFRASVALQRVGAIDIARHSTTRVEFTRTKDLLRSGSDALLIGLVERGTIRQPEDDQTFEVGDAIIDDSAYCTSAILPTDSQF